MAPEVKNITPETTPQAERETIPLFIMGKRYDVPAGLTIQKALEYAGYQLIRGCGCRGGICGACGTVYRFPNDNQLHFGLACQTLAEPYMYLTQIPFFPANKAVYDLKTLTPSGETMRKLYPEILRCMGCNTCTKTCPMDIEVMEYIAAAIRGDIEQAAKLSFDCVMCGLCAARCPGELNQYNAAILARRLYARYIAPRAQHLKERCEQIRSGRYEVMMREVMKADQEQLKKLYNERQVEPEMTGEEWTPQETKYL